MCELHSEAQCTEKLSGPTQAETSLSKFESGNLDVDEHDGHLLIPIDDSSFPCTDPRQPGQQSEMHCKKPLTDQQVVCELRNMMP